MSETRSTRYKHVNTVLLTAFVLLSFMTLLQSYVNRLTAQAANQQLTTKLDTSTDQTGKLINQVESLGKTPVVSKEQIPEKLVQGPQGERGLPGLQGLSGPAGPQGPPGMMGPRGLPGNSPACLLEPSRCVGPSGKDGAAGTPGKDGVPGKDGANGIDGKDGKDGLDGKNGTDGSDGANGAPGKDGADGKDGVADVSTGPNCAATPDTYVSSVQLSYDADNRVVGMTCTREPLPAQP